MEITIKVSEHTYVVSCKNPDGKTVYHWNALRKQFNVGISIDGGEPKVFSYYDSHANFPCHITDEGLKSALWCIASDAMSYETSESFEDFTRELGFATDKEAENIYKSCKDYYDFFESYGVDLFELTEYLDEI